MTPYERQYAEALSIVSSAGKATTKLLQDKMLIGYNRANTIIEQMERDGHIGGRDHTWLTDSFK